MRHRNPLIFDTAWGHRGGDAERLLERVVKRIEDQPVERRTDGGATSDRGDLDRDDVNMSCEDTAADHGRGAGVGHAATAGGGDDGAHDKAAGAGLGSESHERADADEGRGYAAGEGDPGPREPPYSGTPTGDARSGELRADLQRASEPLLGRKRGGSPASGREAELRPVRRCLDRGPEWGARSDGEAGGGGGGRVHLLSLFDGVGTAMVAMVELFAAMGCPDKFAGGWFAEREDHLAVPVARYWADRGGKGRPRFERVAGDVWDLLRNRGSALARMLRDVEPGAMLVIIGGSPLPTAHPRWTAWRQGGIMRR